MNPYLTIWVHTNIHNTMNQISSINSNQRLAKDNVWPQILLQFKTTTLFKIFLLDANFNKFTIGLHFLLIFSMLIKFIEN